MAGIEKAEEAAREVVARVVPPQPKPAPPVYQAPSYSGWTPPIREKYGPPWPPPYGPPIPKFLKEKMAAAQSRSVPYSAPVHDPAEDHPDMT